MDLGSPLGGAERLSITRDSKTLDTQKHFPFPMTKREAIFQLIPFSSFLERLEPQSKGSAPWPLWPHCTCAQQYILAHLQVSEEGLHALHLKISPEELCRNRILPLLQGYLRR